MATQSLTPEQFQKHLLTWQQRHGRHDLPWQQDPSPYRILVSEVMLQQTQVVTVIPYFERWMASFPTLERLASATEDDVMSHWQGLGYYSRARNLRKAAIYICETYTGIFPSDIKLLQNIPGVGRYTAGAIASFAFNTYGPIVDGNVKRLFCRYFGIEGVPGTSVVDKQLWSTAEAYTPTINNRQYTQGLLDMGATVCKPKKSHCDSCSFAPSCIAYQSNRVSELPTPKPKKVTPTKSGHFLWLESDRKLLLERRADNGIWGGLWCLPQIDLVPEHLDEHIELKGTFKHIFSHYKLDGHVWTVNQLGTESSNQKWVTYNDLELLGLPTPIRKFIHKKLS